HRDLHSFPTRRSSDLFGRGNFGTFTFNFNGNYLARFVRQPTPAERKINFDGDFIGVRFGSYPQNRWYASLFYDLGGLDAGAIVRSEEHTSELQSLAYL